MQKQSGRREESLIDSGHRQDLKAKVKEKCLRILVTLYSVTLPLERNITQNEFDCCLFICCYCYCCVYFILLLFHCCRLSQLFRPTKKTDERVGVSIFRIFEFCF